jgi:cytochrome P450
VCFGGDDLDLSVLKVQKRLNAPQSLPLGERVVALDGADAPKILVLDQTLARACLKHPDVAPFDLWGFYKTLTRLDDSDVPQIADIFDTIPLLKDGQIHRDMRRDMAPLYRRLDASIGAWAEDIARDIFSAQSHDPRQLASDYADGIFRRLCCATTGLPEAETPDFPRVLFKLSQRRDNLLAFDRECAAFKDQLQTALSSTPDQALGVLALVVMGHDALKGALHFGLSQGILPQLTDGQDWTSAIEAWFQKVSPVGVLPRIALADFEIDGIRFAKGQVIYICPHILHDIALRRSDNCPNNSFAFGAGPHMCPGRSLSLKAAAAFFKVAAESGWQPESDATTTWRRDLLLIGRNNP